MRPVVLRLGREPGAVVRRVEGPVGCRAKFRKPIVLRERRYGLQLFAGARIYVIFWCTKDPGRVAVEEIQSIRNNDPGLAHRLLFVVCFLPDTDGHGRVAGHDLRRAVDVGHRRRAVAAHARRVGPRVLYE